MWFSKHSNTDSPNLSFEYDYEPEITGNGAADVSRKFHNTMDLLSKDSIRRSHLRWLGFFKVSLLQAIMPINFKHHRRFQFNITLLWIVLCSVSLADGIPSAYTVKFAYTYKWYNANSGKVLVQNKVGCNVSVDGSKVLIQPYSLAGATNVVFHVWATSPFATNEWIVGGETMSPTDTIKSIWLDNNPTRSCSDLSANLGRILFISNENPVFKGLSKNERYYLDLESGSYRANELKMQYSKIKYEGQNVCNEIIAYSPNYYRQMISATQFVTNSLKDGNGRKLWHISISSFTNWNGYIFPSKFQYVRYRDVKQRIASENLDPVVLCQGWVISIRNGADTDITPRLSKNLAISDFRFDDVAGVGRAVGYTAPSGEWPAYDSKEFKEIAASNKMVAAHLSHQSSSVRARFLFILAFSLLLIVPALVFAKRIFSTNKNHN